MQQRGHWKANTGRKGTGGCRRGGGGREKRWGGGGGLEECGLRRGWQEDIVSGEGLLDKGCRLMC